MKKILSLLIIVVTLLPCLHAGHCLPKCFFGHTEMQLDIPLLFDGKTSPVIAEMLFRIVYKEVAEEAKETSSIVISPEAVTFFYFRGEEESLMRFYRAFYQTVLRTNAEGVSNETFLLERSRYVEELRVTGALDKANAVDQLRYEEVFESVFLANTMLISMEKLIQQIESDYVRSFPICPSNHPILSNLEPPELAQHQEDPCLPYYELRLTPSDSQNIVKLITYLAMSKPKILLNKNKVEKVGDDVRAVHPLRFIGHIISTPNLKKKLKKEIEGSLFVWGNFVKGFGERMSKEKSHGRLDRYIPGFCQHLGISEQTVHHYISQEKWEDFVKFLITTN